MLKDIEITDKLKFFDFPLLPEKRKVKKEELSEFQNFKRIPNEKLISDLYNKKNYIIHYKLLEYYVSLGIKVIKVHKVLTFEEEAWLKPYIDFKTTK